MISTDGWCFTYQVPVSRVTLVVHIVKGHDSGVAEWGPQSHLVRDQRSPARTIRLTFALLFGNYLHCTVREERRLLGSYRKY